MPIMQKQAGWLGYCAYVCDLIALCSLLVTQGAFCAGAVSVVSVDAAGIPLRHGAGWQNGRSVQAPVNNDGQVAFTAPMPDYDNSPEAQYHASYLGGNAELSMLYPGVDPLSVILESPLRTTNTELAGDAFLRTIAILCDERSSASSAATLTQLHIWSAARPVQVDTVNIGSSPEILATHCHVAMAANGQCGLVYGRELPATLYRIQGGDIVQTTDVSAWIPSGDGRKCISGDGDGIFFAAALAGYGLLAGQNGIFRFDRSSASLAFVCAAGAISLDPELSVSADGNTVAFRRRTGALAIAQYQDGTWVCPDDYPIQAALCRNPTVNADGRFVAYEASSGDVVQVFRYDHLRRASDLVSASTSGQPANADCNRPAISPDGRFVTFVSAADNLGAATNGNCHVFRRELDIPTIAPDWMQLRLHQGWNMVAVPFAVDQASLTIVRASAVGTLWAWDANKQRYASLNGNIAAGQGFWLHAEEDCIISITGGAQQNDGPLLPTHGWHLLGLATVSATPSLPLAPPAAAAVIFGLEPVGESYTQHAATDLEYGRAYWTFFQPR